MMINPLDEKATDSCPCENSKAIMNTFIYSPTNCSRHMYTINNTKDRRHIYIEKLHHSDTENTVCLSVSKEDRDSLNLLKTPVKPRGNLCQHHRNNTMS